MNGQYFRAAPEQLRHASPEELQGAEAVEAILRGFPGKEILEDGVIDLTAQEFPPDQVSEDAKPIDVDLEEESPETAGGGTAESSVPSSAPTAEGSSPSRSPWGPQDSRCIHRFSIPPPAA